VEAAARIRDEGGLVGLPHPFDRFRQGAGRRGWETELDSLIPLLDFVEAWNARLFIGDGNARGAEFATKHGLPGVAVSDAHTVLEVGVAYTVLEGAIGTPEQMRAALPNARLVTAKGSRVVRMGMPLTKLIQRMRGNRRVAPA
jgi:predicted metal-dependent phosphoesterase TrpH